MQILLRSNFIKNKLKATQNVLHGLVNIVLLGNIKLVNHSTVTAATSRPVTFNLEKAKPITQCPKVTAFELIRGFLPGGKFYKKDTSEYLQTLLREKGDCVFLPSLLGRPNVFLTQNPNDFATILRNEGIWPKRTQFYVFAYYRNVLRKDKFGQWSGLMTTVDKAWYDIRNIVNPILVHPKNAKIYLPILSNITEEFIDRIKQIRNPNSLEVPANFNEDINNWSLECISVIGLDQRLGFIAGTNQDGVRLARSISKFIPMCVKLETKLSFWRYLPNRTLKRLITLLDEECSIVEKYIDQSIKRIDSSREEKPDDEKSILEKLLKVNRQIAVIMALDMMLAGTPTTSSSFSGLLLCLAKNPIKQQKLRDEILTVLPKKDSPLTVESMKNLPYLRACIKESLRMFPVFPGIKRSIPSDMVLSGYRVPKNTDCFMINLNLLHDEEHYSLANEFIPERWLRKNQTASTACPEARKSDTPFVYMPFGFGPRSCVGRRIAEMELEIGIARVIRNFHVEFNYPLEKAFQSWLVSLPAIPLKFKFSDVAN